MHETAYLAGHCNRKILVHHSPLSLAAAACFKKSYIFKCIWQKEHFSFENPKENFQQAQKSNFRPFLFWIFPRSKCRVLIGSAKKKTKQTHIAHWTWSKNMKEDKSEVIATSNDLCNPNQTILIVGEDDHVIIHSEKKVNQGFFRPKSSIFQ